MLSMKIVFRILFIKGQDEMVFSSDFEKNSITENNNIKTAPHTHNKYWNSAWMVQYTTARLFVLVEFALKTH